MSEPSEIRLAVASEAASIADMSRDYIEQGLGWSWTPARIAAAIADQSTNVVVLQRPGIALAGFAIMQYGDRSAHLALLAVHPLKRRRGIAARLLAWLEKCADTAGIEAIRVEARADNPGALAFYRKHGYLQTGRLINYYRGVLDAVRFEKTLRALLQVDGARHP
ncbi:MAG TPA: GNAT family N-acetyltransferase [Steroidobacteraceae bacterium]|jgi:ribosomal protein S18 acetylase RimI-like enzyme